MSIDYSSPNWMFKCAHGHRCEAGEAVAAEALRELAELKARIAELEAALVYVRNMIGSGLDAAMLGRIRECGPLADDARPQRQAQP